MVAIEMGVELAEKYELTGMAELQSECTWRSSCAVGARQKLVGPLMAGTVEEIVADNRVIVCIHVHPLNGFAGSYCYGERRKSILARDYDHLMTLTSGFFSFISSGRRHTGCQK